jgi:hypothetical protein
MLLAAAANAAEPAPVLLHAFVVNGVPVGYLYGFREPNTSDAFTRLEIRSATSVNYRVLYRIERTGLYLADGKLDAEIGDDGSRGFFMSAQRPDYVTIECCRVRTPSNGAMDPITIEWYPEAKQFALLKTP